jgi:hypothetical protein
MNSTIIHMNDESTVCLEQVLKNYQKHEGNRVGIRLSYRPARLHSLAELVPRNRFLGSLKV